MAQITPWEISAEFTKILADKNAANAAAQNTFQLQGMRDAGDAAAATTAFDRSLYKDDIDFGQQIQRDNSQRQFQHDENKLINLDYKVAGAKRGRAGYVNAPTGAGGSGAPTGAITPQYAFSYLTGKGMPPVVAAGLVGNIHAETGWDPAVFSGQRRGDSGTAYGSGQWRGSRQQHLFEYAQSRGHARPTVEDQLDFYYEEAASGRDPGATKAFTLAANASSPEEAAQYIMDFYERPADQSSAASRRGAARQIFDMGGSGMPVDNNAGVASAVAGIGGQRRYGSSFDSTPFPTVQEQGQATPDTDEGFYAPQQPWSVADFQANGITANDMYGLPQDMDVVDSVFFSGAQLELLDPSMRRFLHPVGGYAPDETNQYLVLRPKAGAAPRDFAGNPIGAADENVIGGAPEPELPNPSEMQTAPSTGIAAPYIPVDHGAPVSEMAPAVSPIGTAPTGQPTRRGADGSLEFLVDGAWRPTGG